MQVQGYRHGPTTANSMLCIPFSWDVPPWDWPHNASNRGKMYAENRNTKVVDVDIPGPTQDRKSNPSIDLLGLGKHLESDYNPKEHGNWCICLK